MTDKFDGTTFEPGFIGISRGDLSLNAVAINIEGEPCFFPVTADQANRIEDWASLKDPRPIQTILPDLDADMRELLLSGLTPEQWADTFGEEDEYDDDNAMAIVFTADFDEGNIH